MAKTRSPFAPSHFLMDDGTLVDASTQSGLGMANAGVEHVRQRRDQLADLFQRTATPDQRYGAMIGGRSMLTGQPINYLPSRDMDAFFGLMQMKENAAKASGMKFDVEYPFNATGAFGSDTSTAIEPNQLALSGLRRATSRQKK